MAVSTCTKELEYKHSILTYFLFKTDGIYKGNAKETLKLGDTRYKTGESLERFQSLFCKLNLLLDKQGYSHSQQNSIKNTIRGLVSSP